MIDLKKIETLLEQGETELRLSHCGLDHQGVIQLAELLSQYPNKITYLDVSYNNIGTQGLLLLTQALIWQDDSLTHLNLAHNKLFDPQYHKRIPPTEVETFSDKWFNALVDLKKLNWLSIASSFLKFFDSRVQYELMQITGALCCNILLRLKKLYYFDASGDMLTWCFSGPRACFFHDGLPDEYFKISLLQVSNRQNSHIDGLATKFQARQRQATQQLLKATVVKSSLQAEITDYEKALAPFTWMPWQAENIQLRNQLVFKLATLEKFQVPGQTFAVVWALPRSNNLEAPATLTEILFRTPAQELFPAEDETLATQKKYQLMLYLLKQADGYTDDFVVRITTEAVSQINTPQSRGFNKDLARFTSNAEKLVPLTRIMTAIDTKIAALAKQANNAAGKQSLNAMQRQIALKMQASLPAFSQQELETLNQAPDLKELHAHYSTIAQKLEKLMPTNLLREIAQALPHSTPTQFALICQIPILKKLLKDEFGTANLATHEHVIARPYDFESEPSDTAALGQNPLEKLAAIKKQSSVIEECEALVSRLRTEIEALAVVKTMIDKQQFFEKLLANQGRYDETLVARLVDIYRKYKSLDEAFIYALHEISGYLEAKKLRFGSFDKRKNLFELLQRFPVDTDLYVASFEFINKQLDAIKSPEDKQAFVNEKLQEAVQQGWHLIAKITIAMGASLKQQTPWGDSLLHLAAKQGHLHIIKILVPHLDVNLASITGATPLHLACQHDQLSVALCLLDHGADTTAKNAGDKTPTQLAPAHYRFLTQLHNILKDEPSNFKKQLSKIRGFRKFPQYFSDLLRQFIGSAYFHSWQGRKKTAFVSALNELLPPSGKIQTTLQKCSDCRNIDQQPEGTYNFFRRYNPPIKTVGEYYLSKALEDVINLLDAERKYEQSIQSTAQQTEPNPGNVSEREEIDPDAPESSAAAAARLLRRIARQTKPNSTPSSTSGKEEIDEEIDPDASRSNSPPLHSSSPLITAERRTPTLISAPSSKNALSIN